MSVAYLPGRDTSPRLPAEQAVAQPTPAAPDFTLARCAGAERDAWLFHDDAPLHLNMLAAHRYCRDCPLAQTCLQLGRDAHMQGVYGGRLRRRGYELDLFSARCWCDDCIAMRDPAWSPSFGSVVLSADLPTTDALEKESQ